jgi:hypothetical protein
MHADFYKLIPYKKTFLLLPQAAFQVLTAKTLMATWETSEMNLNTLKQKYLKNVFQTALRLQTKYSKDIAFCRDTEQLSVTHSCSRDTH